jgi:hypothetical protein
MAVFIVRKPFHSHSLWLWPLSRPKLTALGRGQQPFKNCLHGMVRSVIIDLETVSRGNRILSFNGAFASMTRHLSVVATLCLLTVFILINATPATATVTLVTSRSALAGTDSLDWANAAPDYTAIANPFPTNSNGSIPVTVSEPGSLDFARLTQPSSWFGNFAPGDAVLYVGNGYTGSLGPITIDFGSQLLSAFGSQIQAVPTGAFTAELDIYNGATLEGTVTEGGISGFTNDGTAIFIGLTSDVDFNKVVISIPTDTGTANDFGINQADFIPVAVPEPSAIILLVLGVAGLAAACRYLRSPWAPAQ